AIASRKDEGICGLSREQPAQREGAIALHPNVPDGNVVAQRDRAHDLAMWSRIRRGDPTAFGPSVSAAPSLAGVRSARLASPGTATLSSCPASPPVPVPARGPCVSPHAHRNSAAATRQIVRWTFGAIGPLPPGACTSL